MSVLVFMFGYAVGAFAMFVAVIVVRSLKSSTVALPPGRVDRSGSRPAMGTRPSVSGSRAPHTGTRSHSSSVGVQRPVSLMASPRHPAEDEPDGAA